MLSELVGSFGTHIPVAESNSPNGDDVILLLLSIVVVGATPSKSINSAK